MKIGQSSSFQKLISGKIESKENQKNEKSQTPNNARSSDSTQNLKRSVESNKQASTSIRQVEKEIISDDPKRAEVEIQVQEASKSKVEDVERQADRVADKIRDNPQKALDAQANQSTSKVTELLK